MAKTAITKKVKKEPTKKVAEKPHKSIYLPREDSYLTAKHIPAYAKGRVLDMGTGSGYLAKCAANTAKEVIAVDINPEAVKYARSELKGCKSAKCKKVSVIHSDLFSKLKLNGKAIKFNLIIFNPPYLPEPEEKYARDKALDGGKKGWEVIDKFMSQAPKHLKKNGKILLLFSSLTDKAKVEGIIRANDLVFHELDHERLDFEILYVYLIEVEP